MSDHEIPRGDMIAACVVARALGLSPKVVRRYIAIGLLRGKATKAYRDGRRRWFVWRDSFDAFRDRSST